MTTVMKNFKRMSWGEFKCAKIEKDQSVKKYEDLNFEFPVIALL